MKGGAQAKRHTSAGQDEPYQAIWSSDPQKQLKSSWARYGPRGGNVLGELEPVITPWESSKHTRKQNEKKAAHAKTHFIWPGERNGSISRSHPLSLQRPALWCSTEPFLSLSILSLPVSLALCFPLPGRAPTRGLRSLILYLFHFFNITKQRFRRNDRLDAGYGACTVCAHAFKMSESSALCSETSLDTDILVPVHPLPLAGLPSLLNLFPLNCQTCHTSKTLFQ